MRYQVNDRVNGPRVYETEAEAQTALPVAQAAFLDQESYRFSVVFVEVNGNDTTWRNAVDSDPDSGDYQVFNHNTGQHEGFSSKTLAYARLQELKTEFLALVKLDKVYEHTLTVVPNTAMPTTIL